MFTPDTSRRYSACIVEPPPTSPMTRKFTLPRLLACSRIRLTNSCATHSGTCLKVSTRNPSQSVRSIQSHQIVSMASRTAAFFPSSGFLGG